MDKRQYGRRSLVRWMAAFAVAAAVGMAHVTSAALAHEPQHGGELVAITPAEPPSFDTHRETTFAVLHPLRHHYNLLVRYDMETYPEIIGDLAHSWDVSDDGTVYTFYLEEGVEFHDGTPFTARDVIATYQKIIAPGEYFPDAGVASAREALYEDVVRFEAIDDYTVEFEIEQPSLSFMARMAAPWNPIYSADILEEDPRWYESNVMGTGPFVFDEYVGGSHWRGVRNENYFREELPYLDAFQILFISSESAQNSAIRGGRAHIQLRGFTPAQVDELTGAMGDDVTVQESPWVCSLVIAMNTEREPFDDPRVRRALNMAIDRWGAEEPLSRITFSQFVGGVVVPGAEWAASEEELQELPGYWTDIEASREEAQRLLAEAGVEEGFSFEYLDRDVPMPYEPTGIFLIDQWSQLGLNVDRVVQETGPFLADLRGGAYDVSADWVCDYTDDPDIYLDKWISDDRSPRNYSRYVDRELDDLYDAQAAAETTEERIGYIREFEARVAEQGYNMPVLWWNRIIVHDAQLQGWYVTPTHYLDEFERVWFSD